MPPLDVYHLVSFSLFFLIVKSYGISNTSSSSSSTNICGTYDCGNGLAFRYPFWHVEVEATTADQYCGYPGFGLTCSADGEPILTLPTDSYYVKQINYTDSTVHLVDIDVVGHTCPRARHNVTLGTLPLNYSHPDLNLSFFFNCTSYPPLVPPIGCLGYGKMKSYVFTVGNETEGFDWFENCEENVVVPVIKTTEITSDFGGLIGGFGGAMNEGFVLDWGMAKECGSCEANGGLCGYNNTAHNFLCFCKDETRTNGVCKQDNNSWDWKRKFIVGVCTAVATVAIMCVIFFVHQRRNRKLHHPSSFVTRSILSSTYSMDDDMEKGSTYHGVHIFSYKELEEATNYFDSAKVLGDGGFGTVYHGNLRDGRVVAVKRLYENNFKRVEQFMNEIEILADLRHQNLVLLYGCTSHHSRELLLVYEYIPNGTVAEHLHGEKAKPGALPWLTRIKIAIETANALSYLHASDIIHRDVKTTNILLDDFFCVKVADFGLSRLFPMNVTHISTAPQGTPGYVDPEYNQCYQLTSKSDVYSFGVVLIELISSMPAVDITRHRHEINLSTMAINKIQNHTLHELVDPYLGFESDSRTRKMIIAVAELAFRCLNSDKDLRPSMIEVLNELKRIQSDDFDIQKTEEIDISANDVVPLKSDPLPASPDSVALRWTSVSTTPNASG